MQDPVDHSNIIHNLLGKDIVDHSNIISYL